MLYFGVREEKGYLDVLYWVEARADRLAVGAESQNNRV